MHGMSAGEAGLVLIVTYWTGVSSNLYFVVRAAGQQLKCQGNHIPLKSMFCGCLDDAVS